MLLHRWVHIQINDHIPILFCALWDQSLYFLIWLFLINQSTHDFSFHVSSSSFLLHSACVSACLFECVCTRDCIHECVFVCVKERYVGPWIYVCSCTHALVDALYYVDMEMQKEKIHLSPLFLRERLLTEHEVRMVFSKPMWLHGAWLPQFWDYVCMDTPDFLYGKWYSNSGFRAWLDSGIIH